jgi:hypothetical protein
VPNLSCVISGFFHSVNEIFALLGCYAKLIDSLLLTCRFHLQGLSSQRRRLKMELLGCPEMLLMNYQSTLRNIPEEQRPLFQLLVQA